MNTKAKRLPVPSEIEPRLTALLEGLSHTFPPGLSLNIGGVSLTPVQLAQRLQAYLALCTAVANTKSSHVSALAARNAAEPAICAFAAQLGAGLSAFYGLRSPSLGAFQEKPRLASVAATSPKA